jgi:hypothetical protein
MVSVPSAYVPWTPLFMYPHKSKWAGKWTNDGHFSIMLCLGPCSKSNPRCPCFKEGGDVLGWRTGLWSTEDKVWGLMLMAAWRWGGDSSVTNDTFVALVNILMIAIKRSRIIQALQLTAMCVWKVPHGNRNGHTHALWMWCFSNSDFVAYVNSFMEPSDYDDVPLCKILYFVRDMGLYVK